jgi:hypothetical protein
MAHRGGGISAVPVFFLWCKVHHFALVNYLFASPPYKPALLSPFSLGCSR